MTSRKRTVGVLGGMGPEATILFMQRVLAAVEARDDSDHIPLLIDNNTQTPSRIAALIDGTGADPAPVLAGMARRLAGAGAEALVMPCNTAHAYEQTVRDAVGIPFLSMMELTAARIAAERPGATVGLLASPATREAGVFERPLRAQGLTPLYAEDQDGLLAAIRALKVASDDTNAAASVIAAGEQLLDAGADLLLIGCSEFSLIKERIAQTGPTVDSLDVLVSAAVSFATRREDRDAPDWDGGTVRRGVGRI